MCAEHLVGFTSMECWLVNRVNKTAHDAAIFKNALVSATPKRACVGSMTSCLANCNIDMLGAL